MPKKVKELFWILLIMGLIVGCSKEETTPIEQQQELPEEAHNGPKLGEVAPLSGTAGTLVTIKGEYLTGVTKVYFNGVESASILSGGENAIIAEVPFRAFTGTIKIMFEEEELIGPEFEYLSSNRVSTVAGSRMGYADGNGEEAEFSHPRGIVLTAAGNLLVSDYNHRIRSISSEGVVSTLTGSTADFEDGTWVNAKFNNPGPMVADPFGHIFISDVYNHKIRKVISTGSVVTWSGSSRGNADGFAMAQFSEPKGLAMDSENNIYVADSNNHRIRKIGITGTVTTIAGSDRGFKNGVGTEAQFSYPTGIAVDDEYNIYVADAINNRIRKINPQGEVSTYAGGDLGFKDGPASESQFVSPTGLALDTDGTLYVADANGNRIRKINPDGMVSTIAGGEKGYLDGPGEDAQFNHPWNLALDKEKHILYVTDFHNHRIRKILLD
ncbi:SMP-30/gluconolactonase/LRE family protein [Flagellimonas algicola]|uniref:NHL repeat-containing protein n=1 Tax=Flagellimonas algicola TaxID=2583815 RepID=A0ABY2WJA7_9FLAO|nr:SMP-30/gluconolactonase/LRE family protein [Allomuricauda algicola]TMU54680.1 hypothetical protein FGG15_10775 [Allomuricauda algicola]